MIPNTGRKGLVPQAAQEARLASASRREHKNSPDVPPGQLIHPRVTELSHQARLRVVERTQWGLAGALALGL